MRSVYNRYDLACLCFQDHLKKLTSSTLLPDQQSAFIEALFPRLYSEGMKEYPRIISDLQHLTRACTEQTLTHELCRVREAGGRVIAARDQAIKIDNESYNKYFLDAFHNPLLGFSAPWYYDMIADSTPASVEEVIALLSERVSRRQSD